MSVIFQPAAQQSPVRREVFIVDLPRLRTREPTKSRLIQILGAYQKCVRAQAKASQVLG
jgi:hypothetical protein